MNQSFLPVIRGVIHLRILVNYRMDPEVAAGLILDRIDFAFREGTCGLSSGAMTFDSAFVMRDIEHEWHTLPPIETGPGGGCVRRDPKRSWRAWNDQPQRIRKKGAMEVFPGATGFRSRCGWASSTFESSDNKPPQPPSVHAVCAAGYSLRSPVLRNVFSEFGPAQAGLGDMWD